MRKKKAFKNLIIIGALLAFVFVTLVFGIFKNQEIFSEGMSSYSLTPKIETESNINIEEIRKKIDTMTLDEIEKTISEIEKEIEKLNVKLKEEY